jgi:glutathione S-transferase
MKLYSGPLSLFARKTEIALNEKGLAFERVFVPFTQTAGYAPKHPEVLRIHPLAKVPVLVDGDLELFDSTLIFEYLEDAYPKPPLYPRDSKGRARCRMVEAFADEVMLVPLAKLMHRTEPPWADTAARARCDAAALEAEGRLLELYGALEARLGNGTHFAGELSVADIAVFMTVEFSLRLGGPGLERHPVLAAWFRRVAARPAFARAAAEMAEADRQLSQPITRRWA